VTRTSAVIQSEQLLQALSQCDDQLDRWISKSEANAVLLMEDPMAAMQAAAADLDQDVLRELEAILSGLARKLDMPISPLPTSAFRRPS
jgi:type III secretory pathway lipoprotein EscJ